MGLRTLTDEEKDIKKNSLFHGSLETACVTVFLFISSFIFMTESPLHIWIGSDSGTDSSVFSTVAMMMDRGYMPYRDTFDHKGPLLYVINYLGRHISLYRGVWVIEFVSMFMTFLLIYKIARLQCGKVLSCIVLLTSISLLFDFFHGGNFTEEYAMPLIAGALFIFLDYFLNLKISKFRIFLCGSCLGGVCLLRPNMISVWIIFCIAVTIQCIWNRDFINLRNYIIFFMLGFFLSIIPFFLWLVINNSFSDFWYQYINFNFIFTFSRPGIAVRWDLFFASWGNPLLTIVTIISVYLCKTKNHFLYGTYCCYLFLSLLTICMSAKGSNHYGMILIPAVSFPIASLFSICTEKFTVDSGKAISFFAAMYFLSVFIMPAWYPSISKLAEVYSLKDQENKSYIVNEVCSIIDNNSQYDDRISVYGNWDIIYILSNRAHATKYSYQTPIGFIVPQIMDNYFNELEEQLPQIIVIQAEHYDDRMGDFLNHNNYSLLWSEWYEDGTQIYICNK